MSLFGRKRAGSRGDSYDYWVTATELMSAVVLVFILIGMLALLRAKDEEQQSAACEGDLKVCNDKLGNAEQVKAQLAACQLASKESQDALVSCVASLAACQAEKDAILSSNQECSKLQNQRAEIDAAIRAFLKKMGLDVDGAAGVVRIDAELLFETGSDLLKDQGRKKLDEIMPGYANAVMQPSVRGAVRRVLIEGHSSRVGGDVFNMRLSALRALAIYEHLRTRLPPFADKKEFLELLTPAGRGELDSKGGPDSDLQEDRSVELRIEFKLPDPVTVPVDQLPPVAP
jgi:outer membrane protein OmpA-like peptidoglycan-associated protein